MHHLVHQNIIESLERLGKKLNSVSVPAHIVEQACKDHVWFTPKSIQYSLQSICSWFDAEKLFTFWHHYPTTTFSRRIGIIAAGNIPFVGVHDLIVSVLAGHTVYLKPSHQDKVLMEWFVQTWIEVCPPLVDRIKLVPRLGEVDFLIATGTNHTALHLQRLFQNTSKLIRQNRFSVAVLGPETSETALKELSKDIFTYHGMGCRSVSNIVLMPGFDLESWIQLLKEYDREAFSDFYFDKINKLRAKMVINGEYYIDAGLVLLKYSEKLAFAEMGVLNLVKVNSSAEASNLMEGSVSRIQLALTKQEAFGSSQFPAFDEFADEVDTMALLSSIA